MSDVTFKIDEKNRVVVCMITGCRYIAMDRIAKYTRYCPYHGYQISNTFMGIARCNPEDEFDIEYGKKLALTRAKAKRGTAINNAIIKYVSDTKRELSSLIKYGLHKIPDEEDI